MKPTQKRFEMPSLYTADDFGLDDRRNNRRELERLLAASHRVIHQDDNVLLGINICDGLGELFLCRRDECLLTYYLRFQVNEIEPLGIAATGVGLWRRCAPGLNGGTSHIIHSLLDDYDALVSDPSVNPAGRRYWIDRMAEAVEKGWTVGMMVGDTVVSYDGGRSLLDQVQTLEDRDGKHLHQPVRFFISKTVTRCGGRSSP